MTYAKLDYQRDLDKGYLSTLEVIERYQQLEPLDCTTLVEKIFHLWMRTFTMVELLND